jgi:glycosyltransferase involved in cell wall biosynthesis
MLPTPLRITHIITGLQTGGAEHALLRVVAGMDRERFACRVISLTEEGPVGERLRQAGIPVQALGLRAARPDPWRLLMLVRWLRAHRPHVVQGWLAHGNLLGGVASLFAGRPRLAWNLRNSDWADGGVKRATLAIERICGRLSHRLPHAIISCSRATLPLFAAWGYDPHRIWVIPNGFDLNVYRPDDAGRRGMRARLGLSPTTVVVGHLARFHPQKDHLGFVAAASRVAAAMPQARFVLGGRDVTWENAALAAAIRASGQAERFLLLGEQRDVPALLPAFDLFCLSSAYGEAFPNVLGEAMATGVPCVATDVGDAGHIVGATGRIVPPGDPAALAAALSELVALGPTGRAGLGQLARARVAEHFEMGQVIACYEEFYRDLAGR